MRYADRFDLASAAVEAIFRAFFLDGTDLGDRDALTAIGADIGLDPGPLAAFLASEDDVEDVLNENARAHRLGINGVPCYLFNGRMVISGAQEPQVLARMIDAASEVERVA